jgi:TDG/mug DNA glycosylase family protein
LAASLLPAEKERIWRELGVWVEKRREERSRTKVEKPL